MTINRPSADTSHLYDGKTVRSSAPSRKKAAGQMGAGSDIPEDAIPSVEFQVSSRVFWAALSFPK